MTNETASVLSYLQSAEAEVDVAGYLRNWLPRDSDDEQARALRAHLLQVGSSGWLEGAPSRYWLIQRTEGWIRMTARRDPISSEYLPQSVYFRATEGDDDYHVTDLGEGVKSLRLRTGVFRFSGPQASKVKSAYESSCKVLRIGFDGECWLTGVTRAELPRVIARIAHAAHRIATLEDL